MSLDVSLYKTKKVEVFGANITHNLGAMAKEAGIYNALWRPEEVGIKKAEQLILPLCEGLEIMIADPDRFSKHDVENGWGTYDYFIPWIERYIEACKQDPSAEVHACR